MSSGLAVSLSMPSAIYGTIFSTRRANSGSEALCNSNPAVAAMNLDIASGQILNAAKDTSSIIKGSATTLAENITSAEESIKALSKSDKTIKGIAKVVNFTADNINPLICATSGLKVLTSDEKEKDAVKESIALGTMFASEAAAKKVLGIAEKTKFDKNNMIENEEGIFNIKNGEKKLIASKGKYQILDNKKLVIEHDSILNSNPFFQKQTKAINDFCQTTKVCNKSLKFLPGLFKGIAFALASIFGFKLGSTASEYVINECFEEQKAAA